ncbi:hypothetical protein BD626DRAFT_515642 [Schizophyllum amplum]|uniref:F-box domain-containing protein n=1 Tax=Schizophyllum amplum TaxID=97359 RepID=A0A550BXK7_9AGAR|nr:hypothetical protein BD626DRAFT_515642 [Auriculariopsis ampla]
MSGALPLVIYHDWTCVHDQSESELQLEQLLNSLKSHSTRWESLTLQAPSWLIWDLDAMDLPSLREAIVEIDWFVYDVPFPRILDFLAKAPSLRRLEVAAYGTDTHSEVPKSTFALPALRSLTSLSLDMSGVHVSGPETLSTLNHCATSITQLKLNVRLTHALAGHVQLPVLRVLDLGGSASRILAHVTTPHLQELSVYKTVQWDPMPTLLTFLTRTQQLRRLTLGDVFTENRATFLDCLERMDDLRSLCVQEHTPSSPLLTQNILARMTCIDAPALLQPVKQPTPLSVSSADSPTSLPGSGQSKLLLPSLTAIKVVVRMHGLEQWADAQTALYDMLASRRETRVCGTRVVAALQDVDTKMDRDVT